MPHPILPVLEARFAQHPHRHPGLAWAEVATRLTPTALASLAWMEATGGQPDLVPDPTTGTLQYIDCAPESPTGRRSLCYDEPARLSRKDAPPAGSALGLCAEHGLTLLNEAQYRHLQSLGPVDQKTSSWLLTPDPIRALGGALFGDYRYGTVFVYHNGVQSYYAARGFRALLAL